MPSSDEVPRNRAAPPRHRYDLTVSRGGHRTATRAKNSHNSTSWRRRWWGGARRRTKPCRTPSRGLVDATRDARRNLRAYGPPHAKLSHLAASRRGANVSRALERSDPETKPTPPTREPCHAKKPPQPEKKFNLPTLGDLSTRPSGSELAGGPRRVRGRAPEKKRRRTRKRRDCGGDASRLVDRRRARRFCWGRRARLGCLGGGAAAACRARGVE